MTESGVLPERTVISEIHFICLFQCQGSCIQTTGKVWLSQVVGCFNGKIVSWSLSTRPDAELVNTILNNVVERLNAVERPVIHRDRGGHYRWSGWLERVNAAGLIRSMPCKGCSPDNAVCEGFFGKLKTEMYYGHK